MKTYPCAKINLGLNVVERRADGYHNIETVFYPIPVFDQLEIKEQTEGNDSNDSCLLHLSGNSLDCDKEKNIVVKAYRILEKEYRLPPVTIGLTKEIPSEAGLGGGSSDGSYTLKMLNNMFQLGLSDEQLEEYAMKLGADCPFFIKSKASFATGIGEKLQEIESMEHLLKDHWLVLLKPEISISTKEAYANILPQKNTRNCLEIVKRPIEEWRDALTNDFERPVFDKHPILAYIKQLLYNNGAVYAQMSGSGSAIFGIFKEKPKTRWIDELKIYNNVIKL